jgi:YqaJ-like viral recombinase domain
MNTAEGRNPSRLSRSVDTKKLRRCFIGGSDARIIMGDDEAALFRLWREKRGEVEPEDLSGNLIVQLGLATEDLNRRWYEANTGQVIIDIQKRVWHPALRWMAATLDGRVQASDAVFEAKFMLPWSFSDVVDDAKITKKVGLCALPRTRLRRDWQSTVGPLASLEGNARHLRYKDGPPPRRNLDTWLADPRRYCISVYRSFRFPKLVK